MSSKYQQVSDWIREQIDSGMIKTNGKVDSENDLAARFKISRQTARHAIDQLVKEGLLFRVQGSGTYVGEKKNKPLSEETKSSDSKMVSIISTYVDGYIFPKILQGMVQRLEQAGYLARISFTGNDVKKERELLEAYLSTGCTDPLIVEPVMSGLPNPNMEYYKKIREKGIPVLFFHSYYPDIDIPYIGMDDVEAGTIVTDYLIAKGHRNIGGIFKTEDGQGSRRYQGYQNSLFQHGIAVNADNVIWIDSFEMRDFSELEGKLEIRLRDCTAVICYNDEVAFELTKYAARHGIRIPEDLSIASIDNSDLATLNQVSLTSVRHPMDALGKKAAEGILELINDPGKDVTYKFKCDLIIRDSVKECH